MKKATLILAAFATMFISCNKDNEEIIDPILKGEYVFYEPCINWGADENTVISYVNAMGGWTKSEEEEANKLHFVNEKTASSMSYEFGEKGLEGASVTYFGVNEKFETFKNDITTKYDVTDWRQQEETMGITWYFGTSNKVDCCISMGYSEMLGGYMYADFSRDLFHPFK